MALDAFEMRANEPEVVANICRAVGGASSITKVYGKGITVSRTGTGDYRLTWVDLPGLYLGAVASLQADTESALAGHVAVVGSWSAANKTLDLVVTNASDAVHDLAASEWFTIVVYFARTTP